MDDVKLVEQIKVELKKALKDTYSIRIDAEALRYPQVFFITESGSELETNDLKSAKDVVLFANAISNVLASTSSVCSLDDEAPLYETYSGSFDGIDWYAVITRLGNGLSIHISSNELQNIYAQSILQQGLDAAIAILNTRHKSDDQEALVVCGTLTARFLKDGMTIIEPVDHYIYRSVKVSRVELTEGYTSDLDEMTFTTEYGVTVIKADNIVLLTQ